MKFILNIIIGLTLLSSVQASPAPKVTSGKLEIINEFQSDYIGTRRFYVWLPESFSRDKTFSVLYMQDGQMLFDATTTWNKQDWGGGVFP